MDLKECSDLVIEITGPGGYNIDLNISSKCLQKVNFFVQRLSKVGIRHK